MTDLLELQNRLRKDPPGYIDEFRLQYAHFKSALEVFQLNPKGQDTKNFSRLVRFLAHVIPCYKKEPESRDFAPRLIQLLEKQYEVLSKDVRALATQALMQLSNRGIVSRFDVMPVFFKLFRCQDKTLRTAIFSHLVNDVSKLNRKSRDHKLNSKLQAFFLSMLKDSHPMAVKKSLDVIIEIWSRKLWNDGRVVNAVADMAFSKIPKVKAAALRFFLGVHDNREDNKKKALIPESVQMKNLYLQNSSITNVRRRKKRLRKMERAKKAIKRSHMEEEGSAFKSLAALDLLYDPQAFADRLFSQLRSSTDAFELRLLMMNVISRLIGAHRLLVLNFYPFIQKYLHSGQTSITKILAYLAQASHSLVPPEELAPLIRSLADNFVSDRSSPEVMAVGLNAIREVCARCPLALEADLLQDLTQYKKSKSKGVMMAARSLIAAFREVDPSKLSRKDRGKDASIRMDKNETHEYAGVDRKDAKDNEVLQELMREGDRGAKDAAAPAKQKRKSFGGVRFLTAKDFRKMKTMKEMQSRKRKRGDAKEVEAEEEEASDVENPTGIEIESGDEEADNDMGEGMDAKKSSEGGDKDEDTDNDEDDEDDFEFEDEKYIAEEGVEIDEDAIVGYRPRKKMNKEERRATIKAGRDNIQKKWAMRNPSGTTNREKLKNKPFMLSKYSKKTSKKKNMTSFEQQKAHTKHVKHLKKSSKKNLKSMRGKA